MNTWLCWRETEIETTTNISWWVNTCQFLLWVDDISWARNESERPENGLGYWLTGLTLIFHHIYVRRGASWIKMAQNLIWFFMLIQHMKVFNLPSWMILHPNMVQKHQVDNRFTMWYLSYKKKYSKMDLCEWYPLICLNSPWPVGVSCLPATLSHLKLGFTHGEKKKKDRSCIKFFSSSLSSFQLSLSLFFFFSFYIYFIHQSSIHSYAKQKKIHRP